MPTVLIATTNIKKAGEMLQILSAANPDLEFLTLADFPDAPEVDEVGETFSENATIKAIAGASLSGLVTVADDGGLCIDALDGNPGVKSHRFLGTETSFAEKMGSILLLMANVPAEKRTCRFQCAVSIAIPLESGDMQLYDCTGICEGRIGARISGEHGFGYDPIFFLPEMGKYMAELTPEEKHRISHRGKALACASIALREAFWPA